MTSPFDLTLHSDCPALVPGVVMFCEHLTREYDVLIKGNPRKYKGDKGNCLIISALSQGVAEALGIPSRLFGGKVIYPTGIHFTHAWLVLDGTVLVDSPKWNQIQVTPLALDEIRRIPLHTGKISERRLKKLNPLIDAARRRVIRSGILHLGSV